MFVALFLVACLGDPGPETETSETVQQISDYCRDGWSQAYSCFPNDPYRGSSFCDLVCYADGQVGGYCQEYTVMDWLSCNTADTCYQGQPLSWRCAGAGDGLCQPTFPKYCVSGAVP